MPGLTHKAPWQRGAAASHAEDPPLTCVAGRQGRKRPAVAKQAYLGEGTNEEDPVHMQRGHMHGLSRAADPVPHLRDALARTGLSLLR